jgi:uncharacterized protein YndB with AHSA1/START domain
MKTTVETLVRADLNPGVGSLEQSRGHQAVEHRAGRLAHHESAVDLREGGKFLARMEAKDGSEGFDFEGTYTRIVPQKEIEYRMSDGREVKVEFVERADGVVVKETFDLESANPPEMQRQGWQAILDNFGRHVEAKA